MSESDIGLREKLRAFRLIGSYNPKLVVMIAGFGFITAILEGVGLSFVLPIIDIAQNGTPSEDATGIVGAFFALYDAVGIPFTLEYILGGLIAVISVRYASSFAVAYLREYLRAMYIRYLQREAYDAALDAEVSYFDTRGSDEILNAIITQTFYAGRSIKRIVQLFQQLLLSGIYLAIAFYIAPVLTVLAGVLLGGMTYLVRNVIEPGYDIGDEVAEANERIQETVQAGTQGIRAVRLFGLRSTFFGAFEDAVEQFTESSITLRRNDALITNVYNWMSAVTVFVLIYFAIAVTTLSLSSLAVFLFAMFRLAPRVSTLNQRVYQAEGDLPHVIRTQTFIEELSAERERAGGDEPVPSPIGAIEYDDVTFSYDNSEDVLDDFSVRIDENEFVAFVGKSGSGKSTIVSLLVGLYTLDDGEIRVGDVSLDRLDLSEWRSHVAVVRQEPYIFDDSLRFNITFGREDVSEAELREVCRIAKIDEFLNDLPNGFDSVLGDDGVQLSGGQRQRVALARALLKDADVLVLDEATSNLDSGLEQEVQAEIERMEKDYTVIAIAHRLSTVENADCIYTVKDGQITEAGGHQELLTQNGEYATLYATQTNR
jgi:subfamily B ATP-binding cassette protein MsbA